MVLLGVPREGRRGTNRPLRLPQAGRGEPGHRRSEGSGRLEGRRKDLRVSARRQGDGAQSGDQGKNRKPHDHNRDYSEFIYPETKALTEWIGDHAGGRLDAFIDLHCPWIRGEYNEFVYATRKDPKIMPPTAQEDRFSEILENVQSGALRYKAANDLPFGKKWNKGVNFEQGWSSVIWACHNVKGQRVCRAMEFPFANSGGAVVTPEKCRTFGRDLALALRALIDGR